MYAITMVVTAILSLWMYYCYLNKQLTKSKEIADRASKTS